MKMWKQKMGHDFLRHFLFSKFEVPDKISSHRVPKFNIKYWKSLSEEGKNGLIWLQQHILRLMANHRSLYKRYLARFVQLFNGSQKVGMNICSKRNLRSTHLNRNKQNWHPLKEIKVEYLTDQRQMS